ncbi:MAG: 1-deoxy-D-xylulose-5-phosphate synthase, partial [Lachnospiraceae bacterium]|nr:1-deoxy-D-xylulose-5-phosphate synthase [Lachnospiraceae bacterium]
ALHLSLDLPKDKIIWDVGHQAYTHKLLTGRKEGFDTLRKYKGLSGFPKHKESECDSFDTGHSSTSISAGLGMVKARDLLGGDETVVAVIGDGSLTGGMAYEALNNAARLDTNYIIILNDNNMSISENVGGMNKYLNKIRIGDKYLGLKSRVSNALIKAMPEKGDNVVNTIRNIKNGIKHFVIPGTWFEELGLTYLGPVDGHDIPALMRVIEEAKRVKGAVVIHALTTKGNGFSPAEKHPSRFHGAEPFNTENGLPTSPRKNANYTDIFSTVMIKLAERDEKVVAITAAMPDGTGLKRYRNIYPDRFFDVGIAEQHAVTFAAGLATRGLKPIVAIYSSFLQRAYDQILHDVCIQELPVVFAIDRAGLVGSDGETHQGVFDYSYLGSIPNMHILAPKNKWELSDMMKFAVALGKPVAVRYPRGTAYTGLEEHRAPVVLGKSELLYEGSEVAIFAVGSMVKVAEEVRKALLEQGITPTVINGRFIKPIDEEAVAEACRSHKLIVTMEDNVISGGYGERVAAFMKEAGFNNDFYPVAVPDRFIEHGSIDQLRQEIHMDAPAIVKGILERIR